MPTADQVAKWADEFEHAYPKALADRLRWLHQQLDVCQDRLLLLIGLSPAEVKKLGEGGTVDWQWVADQYSDGSDWAEEMLVQLVAYFQYDWGGLRAHIREPLRVTYRVGQPGGRVVPLNMLTPVEQDKRLLSLITEGSSRAIPALIVFLSPLTARQRTQQGRR